MKSFLKLEKPLYDELVGHLLPPNITQEQAAFLFVRTDNVGDEINFEVIETTKLSPSDFSSQEGDYLELTDETRRGLIKRAHDLSASLVEIHSHLGDWPASFSLADRSGLKDTVPHMWWRLKKRPYLALVFASSGFDALLWIDSATRPRALDAIIVGNLALIPTNRSLAGWK